MFRPITATIVMIMALIVSACAPKADGTDPAVAVVESYYEAMNAGDVDAAISLFHEDASCQTPEGVFHGTDEIKAHLGSIVERSVKYYTNSFELDGDSVTWFTIERRSGVKSMSRYEVVIQDGRIISLTQ